MKKNLLQKKHLKFANYKFTFSTVLIFLLLISITAFPQSTLNNGLNAYYPFTGNANDVSGNNNNPVFNNATLTNDRFGNLNSAYHFNGTSSFMRVANNSTLNFSNQMSIAVWVRPTGYYTGPCYNNILLMKGDADNLSGNYSLRFSDAITGCTNPTTTTERFYDGNGALAMSPLVQLNQWYSVVSTYDGTTARIYVNCVLQNSFVTNVNTFTNSFDLYLGHLNNPQYPYWLNGDLDEVRIYNRALTQTEVNQYGGCAIPCPSDTTLTVNKCTNTNKQLIVRQGTTYSWTPATGLSSTAIQNPTTNVNSNTTYIVTITNAATNCTYRDTVKVVVNPAPFSNIKDTSFCKGDSVQLNAPLGFTTYSWAPTSNINNPNISNPFVSPTVTTAYILTITNGFGCISKDTIIVTPNDCGCEDSCSWSKTGNTFVKPTNFIGSKNNADFKVRTNNTQRMVITASGNIGLNTPAPSKTLDVNGEAVVRMLPTSAPNDKLVLANATGELKSLAPGTTGQYLSGNGTWQTLPPTNVGTVTAADQGVTLDGNTVQLGDNCGNGGGNFLKNREINLNNNNLYFNSARLGKIFMGNSNNSCNDLYTRLEINSQGLKVKNGYASPQGSTSGLRFTNLTALVKPIDNKYNGVLSLDEDGDVIWVNECCNQTGKSDQITAILERLDKLENELKIVKNENIALKSKLNQTDVILDYKQNVLAQNVPNPFTETTTIGYTIANHFSKAAIVFYTAKGEVIKSVELSNANKGQINISASLVAKGIYSYSLIVDGILIETKQMIKQ
jgi:Concanavalin A-like lectin/glucanases superfamily